MFLLSHKGYNDFLFIAECLICHVLCCIKLLIEYVIDDIRSNGCLLAGI